jgi:hypothetical protein
LAGRTFSRSARTGQRAADAAGIRSRGSLSGGTGFAEPDREKCDITHISRERTEGD